MPDGFTILLLEDEPLILMDLEFAAEDAGCAVLTSTTCGDAIALLEQGDTAVDVAILDVSLGQGHTCLELAQELDKLDIPYILHSGDLDRNNELIRSLQAHLVAKPAPAQTVIETAIAHSKKAARRT